MSFSGARHPGASTFCSYSLSYNITLQGGVTASINFFDGGGMLFKPSDFVNPHVGSNLHFSTEGGDITVSVTSASSIWDWSIVVFENGIEIENESETGGGSGGEHTFTFTPVCGNTYDIQLVSNQHA